MAKKSTKVTDDPFAERVELRMSSEEKELFQAAAKRHHISLSHWMRLACRLVINKHEGKVEFDLEG
jgi:uncharacterized protein (DUF1778 family)